jgi:SAM-dependent methyltransferase
VLDFGCGWGRTLRFFLRDAPGSNLIGVDVMPLAIQLCKQTNGWCDFRLSPIMPPTDLPGSAFDLVYLYSVFSHLSEESVDAWVTEFARLLKPGGVLIATTWHRGYIEMCAQSRHGPTPGTHPGSVHAFPGRTEEWLASYDRGEMCHSPVGGGEALSSSFYGETCIPSAYVQQKWARRFHFRKFIDADMKRFWQSVIVVQKPRA